MITVGRSGAAAGEAAGEARSASVGGVFAVAHRAPPTKEACAALRDAGATVFELDVQLAPGRGVVVSHFRPLPRPLHGVERDNWRVRRARELAQDPLLCEALQVVPDDARILLDLKERTAHGRHRLCERLVADHGGGDRWVVSTEETDDLHLLRAAGFHGWWTARGRTSLQRMLAEPFDAEGVSVRHTLLDERTVAALREHTDVVVAWTVNSVARARYLLGIGVSGITTDSPSVVSAVSAAAG
jgi:glycerophosphoryl diester phosphodiesterase